MVPPTFRAHHPALSQHNLVSHERLTALSIPKRTSGFMVFPWVSFPTVGCHSSCRSCQKGGPFSCTSCDTDLVLTHIGTCSTTCFPGYYLDENQACQRKFSELSPLPTFWAFGRNVKFLLPPSPLQRQSGYYQQAVA